MNGNDNDHSQPANDEATAGGAGGSCLILTPRTDWRWVLAAGVLLVVGGTVGVLYGALATIATLLAFGAGLVAAAILHAISAVRGDDARRGARLEHALLALMYLALGVFTLVQPHVAAFGWTIALLVFLGTIALMRLSFAWRRREDRAEMASQLIGALSALFLAGVIVATWPVSALWAIGVLISVELLVNGWMLIHAALAIRHAMQERRPEEAR